MVFGPGTLPYQGIKSPVSTGLPTLCGNTFSCFRINMCSFALFKGMCQWPSCIPPAFSISDSTGSERQSAWANCLALGEGVHQPWGAQHPLLELI